RQLWPAGVQHIALKAGRLPVFEGMFHQFAGIEAPAIDPASPIAGRIEGQHVELGSLECLEARRVVLVDLYGDAVEIVAAALGAQVAGPIVRIAAIRDGPGAT